MRNQRTAAAQALVLKAAKLLDQKPVKTLCQ